MSSESNTDLAATYAALILADEGIEITADKILALTAAAGVELEPIWATLLAKALEGKNIKELLSNIAADSGGGAAAAAVSSAAQAPKEDEEDEEGVVSEADSDEDNIFGLFE